MKQISVQYYDTFREDTFILDVDENLSNQELIHFLDDEVAKRGFPTGDKRRIYIVGILDSPYDEDRPLLLNRPLSIVYSNIVCPSSAQEFDRENGIQYYFHTDERNHLMNPHIHAKTNGDETMSFALNGTWVAGRFKSPAKMKEAKRYIEQNHDIIKAAWDAVIKKGYPLTRQEIEQDYDRWLN